MDRRRWTIKGAVYYEVVDQEVDDGWLASQMRVHSLPVEGRRRQQGSRFVSTRGYKQFADEALNA